MDGWMGGGAGGQTTHKHIASTTQWCKEIKLERHHLKSILL